MADETQRSLGRLEGEQEAMQRELASVRVELKEIRETLNHVAAAIDQAKGGWKALIAAGTIASALTAAAFKLIGWVGWHK